jgi:hypothetical protein
MRLYKLLNFNPEIRDGDSHGERLRQRLLAKAVSLLAAIEDRSTQETINLLTIETQHSKISS